MYLCTLLAPLKTSRQKAINKSFELLVAWRTHRKRQRHEEATAKHWKLSWSPTHWPYSPRSFEWYHSAKEGTSETRLPHDSREYTIGEMKWTVGAVRWRWMSNKLRIRGKMLSVLFSYTIYLQTPTAPSLPQCLLATSHSFPKQPQTQDLLHELALLGHWSTLLLLANLC